MKKAFTLAETLVTLGIIGIVAAMTIPNMVANYKANILHTQLVKAYSILQQALQKMQNDTGMIINSKNFGGNLANSSSGTFMKNFREYFINLRACKNRDCLNNTFIDEEGNLQAGTQKYKTYNNASQYISATFFDDGQSILTDGMLILIENYTSEILITIDINGLYQKPNRWGHDLFTFQVDEKTGKLLPMGAPNTRYDQTYCSTTSNNTYNGIACTYKALTDKDYFKNLPK